MQRILSQCIGSDLGWRCYKRRERGDERWQSCTWKPLGVRLPPTDCWPTQATIWAMLMGEPLEPHWLMIRGLLCFCSVFMHTCASASVTCIGRQGS